MKWSDVPAGIINAAQQRLWGALGEAADVVANNIVENPRYLDSVAAILTSGVASAQSETAEVKKPTLIFRKQTLLGSTPVSVYGLGKRLTFAQMFCALMNLADDAPLDVIEKLAKERKHTLTPEQHDRMLESQAKFFRKEKGGEDFGLRDDGWANLIPVEYPDGTVSVVRARWGGGGWGRRRYSLGSGGVWSRGDRLVVSNSDASDL